MSSHGPRTKKLTRHVVERATERLSVEGLPPDNVIKKMMKYGLTPGDFTGDFYSYLQYIKTKKFKSIRIRVLYDSILIYNKNSKRAITVYPVPPKFLPITQYIKSEENKNVTRLMQELRELLGYTIQIELQVLTLKPNDITVGLCINDYFENYGTGKTKFDAEEKALQICLDKYKKQLSKDYVEIK